MSVGSRAGGTGGSGGPPVVVTGNETPGDNIVTPNDAIDARAFVELFDPTGGNWDAWRMTSVQGAGDVTERLAPAAEDNTNSVYWVQLRAVAASTGAWTNYAPTAKIGTAGISVKGSAGRARYFSAYNGSGVGVFLQLHDKASAPVNNDNSIDRVYIPAGESGKLEYIDGKFCSLGVAIAISTQPIALTLIGALDVSAAGSYL